MEGPLAFHRHGLDLRKPWCVKRLPEILSTRSGVMVILVKAGFYYPHHPLAWLLLPSARRPLLSVFHDARVPCSRSFSKLVPDFSITRRSQGLLFRTRTSLEGGPANSSDIQQLEEEGSRGLLEVAGIIGAATALSKVLGMARETALAAVFGVGPVMTAFSYSSILPSIFLSLLGGINGPFHLGVTAALSKRSKAEQKLVVEGVSTILVSACAAASVCMYVFASRIIDSMGPGLLVPECVDGAVCRDIAILQLKIMAPSALLSALIGVAFGTLSSIGIYGLPSVIPALSSLTILGAVLLHISMHGQMASASPNLRTGGIFVAIGSIFGATLQWLLLAKEQQKAGYSFSCVGLGDPFRDGGVHEVLAVLLPAAIGSGMLQIATFTDLYFASFIPGAAAALGYANLLAMAPIGVLSSSILLPLLPMYSRLSQPCDWPILQERVQQGLLLSMAVTLPMTAVLLPLAQPIVKLVFQRYAFDSAACIQVSSLLTLYVLGSTFYLARDLLVRVFYALGDGQTPFKISMFAICANAVLDWLLIKQAGFGAPGLVIATVTVNVASAGALLFILSKRLGGSSPWRWPSPFLFLAFSTALATGVTKLAYQGSTFLITAISSSPLIWSATGSFLWGLEMTCVIVAGSLGTVSFFWPLAVSKLPEVDSVLELLQTRFRR